MWTWTCSACGQTFTSPVAKRAEADFTNHAREAHNPKLIVSFADTEGA